MNKKILIFYFCFVIITLWEGDIDNKTLEVWEITLIIIGFVGGLLMGILWSKKDD